MESYIYKKLRFKLFSWYNWKPINKNRKKKFILRNYKFLLKRIRNSRKIKHNKLKKCIYLEG